MDEQQLERGRGLLPWARDLATIEHRAVNAGRFGLRLTTDIPTGAVATCPQCQATRTLRETAPNQMGRTARYWSECSCVVAAATRSARLSDQATEAIRGTRDEDGAGESYDVHTLAATAALTLDRFDPTRMADRYPYDAARAWLNDILERQVVGSYRDGPPAALFFVGARGRGKTHLAVALMLDIHRLHRRVAILNEKKYLDQTRTVAFGPPMEALVAVPGERAWLSVFDDIGKHKFDRSDEREKVRVQNAWYSVLDRRYNARRWSIFTSEKTLDELVRYGTLDEATYSRLYEMTRGVHLAFTGDDQRLAVPS